MSVSYAKAKRDHLERSLRDRGASFEALHTLARWYDLPLHDSTALADAVELHLTAAQLSELQEQHEAAQRAEALATGKELPSTKEMPLVDAIAATIEGNEACSAPRAPAALPQAKLAVRDFRRKYPAALDSEQRSVQATIHGISPSLLKEP